MLRNPSVKEIEEEEHEEKEEERRGPVAPNSPDFDIILAELFDQDGVSEVRPMQERFLNFDGTGGSLFVAILLNSIISKYQPLVAISAKLLFEHFSQRWHFLSSLESIQILITPSAVSAFKEIKAAVEQFRNLRERAELWLRPGDTGQLLRERLPTSEYGTCSDILTRLVAFCKQAPLADGAGPSVKNPVLLFNIGAHNEIIDFLRLKFEDQRPVATTELFIKCYTFLQHFCAGNEAHQQLLWDSRSLFLEQMRQIPAAADLMKEIVKGNSLYNEVDSKLVAEFVRAIDISSHSVSYLNFLKEIVQFEGQPVKKGQIMVIQELLKSDKGLKLYCSSEAFRERRELLQRPSQEGDDGIPAEKLQESDDFHVSLIELMTLCSWGKNAYTEIQCQSLISMSVIIKTVIEEENPKHLSAATLDFFIHVSRTDLPVFPDTSLRSRLLVKSYVECEIEAKDVASNPELVSLFTYFGKIIDKVQIESERR